MLSSKQTPKPARMRNENCSPLNIASDCSRTQAIRSTGNSAVQVAMQQPHSIKSESRVFNEFRGRTEYLRTTTVCASTYATPDDHFLVGTAGAEVYSMRRVSQNIGLIEVAVFLESPPREAQNDHHDPRKMAHASYLAD